jgi:hypothetical protein
MFKLIKSAFAEALSTASACGAVVGLTLLVGVDGGFALEPGDFGQTLSGATIGAPLAAPAPPGVYGVLDTFVGPNGVGTGQNLGTSVTVPLWAPTLFWSTGYQFLGANLSMAVVQPFYYVAAYPSNGATLGGNGSGPPFGGAVWFETTSNTLFTPILLSWKLGNGWFAGTGFTIIAPDGSRYNGTTDPDYWTFEPRLTLAYIDQNWHLSANLKYDINQASAGHTGTYQIAANLPFPLGFGGTPLAPVVASIGNGYTSGQQAYLDLAATYKFGKWELGPVAALKWQTTADTPGGGFTCAQLAATLPASLGCGRATNYAVGGLVGYNFGLVDLQVWAVDSVYTRDDYAGWGIFSRLTFKIWGPDAAPPGRPMYTKAPSQY